jgi:hypothetical protein
VPLTNMVSRPAGPASARTPPAGTQNGSA